MMVNYRAVREITIYSKDSGPIPDIHVMEEFPIWEGSHLPDTDELKVATQARLMKDIEKNQIYPDSDTVSHAEFIKRNLPIAPYEERTRRKDLFIQRRRILKALGWKTLNAVNIETIIEEKE